MMTGTRSSSPKHHNSSQHTTPSHRQHQNAVVNDLYQPSLNSSAYQYRNSSFFDNIEVSKSGIEDVSVSPG